MATYMIKLLHLKKFWASFFIIVTLVVAFIIFSQQAPAIHRPVASKGYLDLSGWDFDKHGNLALDGAWEFYWNRLLIPGDLKQKSSRATDTFMKVPAPWDNRRVAHPFAGKGAATYRLRLKFPAVGPSYGLTVVNIRMSSRLFVDGVLLGNSGNPAPHAAGYTMANVPYTVFFTPRDRNVEIIIQVADYDYKSGGITQSIFLGTQSAISVMTTSKNFFELAVFACLFITGVYYLGIYLGVRKETSLLLFSMYCFFFSVFIGTNGQKVLTQICPAIPFELITKINAIGGYGSIILICFFVREIGRSLIPNSFIKITWVSFGLYCAAILFLPIRIFSKFEGIYLLSAVLEYAALIWFLVMALLKKRYLDVGKTGVIYLIAGFFCIAIFGVDVTMFLNAVKTDIFIGNAALLVFILIITQMLSLQYSRAYNAVESMSRKLLELDKLKDEFLANTSHELRTPLNGIINIISSIIEGKKGHLSQAERQDLAIVVASARKLHNLINDILDISSLKQREIKLSVRPVDLRSSVAAVMHVIKHLKGDKDIEFINNIPEALPPVEADPERLRQILYNLLDNALKFTERGRIEAGADPKENMAEIWIEDTGCGIPEDKLAQIFESFYQLDSARKVGGTGLGLSITKTLVELHGGIIGVSSKGGQRTRFTFTMPFSKEPKETVYMESITMGMAETAASMLPVSSSDPVRKKKYAVLAADDDPASLTALFNILDSEGYFVKTVGSGVEVLNELERQPCYNLVILDVMMPKISGYEVLQEIRRRFQPMDLPVLLLTAKARPEDLQAGFDAGASDYIAKPFEAVELRARVKTLVQLKETVNELVATELSFLQAQIRPHFIYNSLSVIAAVSTREPERAKELLYDLSDYLRGSFNFENYGGVTSLSSELATVKAYLSIEKERFKNKLAIECDIDETIDASVPLLTVQPLVENAVRHGVMKKIGAGTVHLSVFRENSDVVIRVTDDGVGIPPEKTVKLLEGQSPGRGVGLPNIQRRLKLLYGRDLEIQSVVGRGTTVVIRIPQKEDDR